MRSEQVKVLVDLGHYKPEPALVAEAMLQKRGVRELLTGPARFSPAGRTPGSPAPRRRAA